MRALIIILCIWGASALIRSAKEAKRRKAEHKRSAELARLIAVEREQIRQAKEQERLAKEQEIQAARIAKVEKEQLALQKRFEDAESTIAKTAAELKRLSFLLPDMKKQRDEKKKELASVAEKLSPVVFDDLDAETENRLIAKYGALAVESAKAERYMNKINEREEKKLSDKERKQLERRKETLEKQIDTLNDKIFKANQKVITLRNNNHKAKMDKAFCEKQMEAA